MMPSRYESFTEAVKHAAESPKTALYGTLAGMRDTPYYDAESVQYSSKRYPQVPSSYIHFFYLRRLAIVTSLIRKTMHGSNLKLIEIGCADGVVTYALADTFAKFFSDISGVDISPKMIEAANAHKGSRKIEFGLRPTYQFRKPYDLVVEVGVINYADAGEEIRSARDLTGENGYYLCSIAGADSLKNRLKHDEEKGFNNFLTYREYEAKLRERFTIEQAIPVGLFIPHIWKVPALARVIQPLCEAISAPFFPNLYLEKVYLLKPRVS